MSRGIEELITRASRTITPPDDEAKKKAEAEAKAGETARLAAEEKEKRDQKEKEPVEQTPKENNQEVKQDQPPPPPPSVYTDEQYDLVGESKACTMAFLIESPLQLIDGIRARVRVKKAKKTITDPKELKAKIKTIKRTRNTNKDETIPLTGPEFDHLKRAYALKAKLAGSIEDDPNLMLFSALMGIATSRVEMFFDDEDDSKDEPDSDE